MYKGATVGVVVPAYNEEEFVGDVLRTVPDFVDRVYAVDDRSTDGTWEEIQRHAAELNRREDRRTPARHATDGGGGFDRRFVPIRHDENRGVGGALKTGYRRAVSDGIDVTAVLGGDGQMDPDHLDTLLDPIVDGDADYAKGNRLLAPEFRAEMPRFRLFGNYVLSVLTKVASGYWGIGDPQNGYTAISRRALEGIELDDLYDRYGFANELLVRLNRHDMRVADVAMPAVYGDEESSIRYRTFVPTLSHLLLKLFLWRIATEHLERKRTGTTLCYGLSFASLVAALGVWLPVTPAAAATGAVARYLPLLLVAASGLLFLGALYGERASASDIEMRITSALDDTPDPR